MRNKIILSLTVILFVCTTSCNKVLDVLEDFKEHPKKPQVTTFATGLIAPLGLETDTKGQLWITEAGTGLTNDGQLSLITSDGKVFPCSKRFYLCC